MLEAEVDTCGNAAAHLVAAEVVDEVGLARLPVALSAAKLVEQPGVAHLVDARHVDDALRGTAAVGTVGEEGDVLVGPVVAIGPVDQRGVGPHAVDIVVADQLVVHQVGRGARADVGVQTRMAGEDTEALRAECSEVGGALCGTRGIVGQAEGDSIGRRASRTVAGIIVDGGTAAQ